MNLRKYRILGGVFRVDLLYQPPQPKDLGKETYLTTREYHLDYLPDGHIRIIDYVFIVHQTSITAISMPRYRLRIASLKRPPKLETEPVTT